MTQGVPGLSAMDERFRPRDPSWTYPAVSKVKYLNGVSRLALVSLLEKTWSYRLRYVNQRAYDEKQHDGVAPLRACGLYMGVPDGHVVEFNSVDPSEEPICCGNNDPEYGH